MSRVPDVSIGLMVYNGADVLARAIDSVLKQTLTSWELIISDDASSDDSALFCEKYSKLDSRIVFHKQARNLGLVGNFAFVARNGSGKYFTWLGQDDFYDDANYLFELFKIAGRDNYDLIFPNIKKFKTSDSGVHHSLAARSPKIESTASAFANHQCMMAKSYIGYQVVYGLSSRRLLNILPLWLNSAFLIRDYSNPNSFIPDEEPYCHFILSRFPYAYVNNVFYAKDMTQSHLIRLPLGQQMIANVWNTLAVIGVIAQAPYRSHEKMRLILLKILRSGFLITMLCYDFLRKILPNSKLK